MLPGSLKKFVACENYGDLTSAEMTGWLQKRLKDCLENPGHEECRANFSCRWKPTRLLDLGTGERSQPRLIITADELSEEFSSAPYVALSHRWGSAVLMTLRRKKLREFKGRAAY